MSIKTALELTKHRNQRNVPEAITTETYRGWRVFCSDVCVGRGNETECRVLEKELNESNEKRAAIVAAFETLRDNHPHYKQHVLKK